MNPAPPGLHGQQVASPGVIAFQLEGSQAHGFPPGHPINQPRSPFPGHPVKVWSLNNYVRIARLG